jgi:hypothetical protein
LLDQASEVDLEALTHAHARYRGPDATPSPHDLEPATAERTVARGGVVEGERAIDYSPIENAGGEDSPATAREDRVALSLYRSWLDAAKIGFPRGAAAIEVDHSRIDSPEEACQLGIQRYEDAGNLIRVAAGVDA